MSSEQRMLDKQCHNDNSTRNGKICFLNLRSPHIATDLIDRSVHW